MTDFEVNFNFENREPVILDATLAPRPQIETEFIINAHTAVATWGSITGLLSNQTDLNNILISKADKTTTVNGYPLSNNITLKLSDLTNDTNFITLSSLSSSATGLSYNNTTGVFSLTSGYTIPLSSTLNTFITKNVNDLTNYRLSASQDIIDTQLQTNITAEANARISADSTLDGRITTETTNRTNADTVLQNNINTEIQNRSNADAELEEAITVNTNSIATEISNRQSADTTLQNNITAEATARANSDTVLSTRITTNEGNITSEVNTRTSITNALRSDLTTETSARTNADNGLQTQITTNSTNLSTHVNRTNNPHSVTKTQVGLGNVDNTSDLNKPISTATQNALNNKANVSTVNNLSTRIGVVEGVIPTEATSSNKLADKNYVDNSIGAGNLTIQKNGTGIVVFNANSTANKTANIVVPTKTSDITNDSNFIDLTDLSSTSPSLTYNNANGQFSVTSGYSITTSIEKNQIGINADDIDDIQELIPNQASSTNQLADKDFVNSTIQTGSANFRGNWNNWASVPIYASEYPLDYQGNRTPHVNDYMVVQTTTDYAPLYSNSRPYPLNFIVYYNNQLYKCIQAIVTPEEFTPAKWQTVSVGSYSGVWRFKYNGTWSSVAREGWQPEYRVNEEPFTQAQLNAINSGATTALIGQITTNQNNITTINNTLSTYGNIVTHNTSEFATSSQGALADTALQPNDNISELVNDENYIKLTSLSTDATGLTYDNTNGKLSLTSSYQIPTSTQVTQIGTNASNIEDLQAIKYGSGIDFSGSTLTLSDQDGNTLDTTTIAITSSLEGLSDVSLSSPANNQSLVYDSDTAKWKNAKLNISDLTDDTATNPIDKADTLTGLTATTTELNVLDGITATTTELNYVDGVTSNIQTQIESKQDNLPTYESGKFLTNNGTNLSWATVQQAPATDNETINLNTDNELQAIGIINNRDNSTALKTWSGTKAQYDAITTKDNNTLYNITDDEGTSATVGFSQISGQPTDNTNLATALSNADNIFWCTYDTTTYAEITAALNAGKIPACIRGSYTYVFRVSTSGGAYIFPSVYKTTSRFVQCTSSGWSNDSFTLESTNNKVTSISSSSTNTQYPSAKCVYDALPKATVENVSPISGTTITVTAGNSIYSKTISANTTFTFDVSGLGTLTNKAVTFELYLTMNTVYTLTFPNSVTWIAEPSFTNTGKYLLVFKTLDGGTTWLGNLEVQW